MVSLNLTSSDFNISFLKEFSKVSLIGMGMKTYFGGAARFFKTIAKHNISIRLCVHTSVWSGAY